MMTRQPTCISLQSLPIILNRRQLRASTSSFQVSLSRSLFVSRENSDSVKRRNISNLIDS